MQNNRLQYDGMARIFHWLIAVLILSTIGVGFYMTGLPLSPQKLQIYSWHKWAGITIFILSVMRIAWRLANPAPALPNTMPELTRNMVHIGHATLYVLTYAIPISGWLMSSAKGIQTVWFGVLPLPDLVSRNKELGDLLLSAHVNLNFLLIALISGHVLMALKHHFIDKDGTLGRMIPKLNPEKQL